ncbi:MAG TPA: hypothetical protein VKB38_21265 [Terracidiphilus sp.]|nr:hypothetical protein [Terracidiphilus sp.]
MKAIIAVLALFSLALPSWATGKKITVAQLEDTLRSMQQDKKSDSDIATELKQLELTEELTRTRMNGLVKYAAGPYSTEQIYVLEARSATLAPPESDLPATPAPDDAAQKAMLARAANYVTHSYDQLPAFTATRTTLRFQDNVEAVAASSGITGSATDVVTSSGFSNPAYFVHYINSTKTQVSLDRGTEKLPEENQKIPWGANKMIALQEPPPSLNAVFRQAQQGGEIKWLRWELINGKPAAVFSFDVPRKVSKMQVKVCCFPKLDQQGIAHFYNSLTAPAFGGSAGGGVSGDWQTSTEWHDFHANPPFHGELFIDPDTGAVARMITRAELKDTDVVHQVDTRIDYGAIKAGARTLVVPVKSYINTLVVPGGDSGAASYTTRCTLFTSEYSDYQTE